MRIFVSHAADDRETASKLVELLEGGMGVPDDHIFFSSQAGTIKAGEFFVQTILAKLAEAELVVCLISRAYLRSQFCLAEAGAAMIKRFGVRCKMAFNPSATTVAAGFIPFGAYLMGKGMSEMTCEPERSKVFTLTIPPTTFSEIGGIFHGVQAGSIQSRETLTELRQIVRADPKCRMVDEVKWMTRLEQFITFAAFAK
jgi:hypothetical protein